MTKALVKKTLLLDNIKPKEYFSENLIRLYGKDLGDYLAKYLTFWLLQKNPDGPYFLDYFQDYSISYDDKWGATYFDVENFGSKFNNVENIEMNELPRNRKNIAIIKMLGKTIKFKKINHFFNVIDLFKVSTQYFGIRCQDTVHDTEKEYSFIRFPEKSVIFETHGNMGRSERGFFCIHFDNTFELEGFKNKNLKKNNIDSEILENFVNFIKITEIKITYTNENLIRFYKTLKNLKRLVYLDYDFNKNQKQMEQIGKTEFIYYLDTFLIILKEFFDKKTKLMLFFQDFLFFKNLPRVAKFVKKNLQDKFLVLQKNKNLWPILFLLPVYLFIRFSFVELFFLIFSLFFLVSTYSTRERRNFPTIRGVYFDFWKNGFSRLTTWSSLKNLFFTFRILYFCCVLDFKIFDVNVFDLPLEVIFIFMQSAKAAAKDLQLGRIFGVIQTKVENSSLVIAETTIVKKQTSQIFSKSLSETAMLETFQQKQAYQDFLTRTSEKLTAFERATKKIKIPETLIKDTAWVSKENSYMPCLAITPSGKRLNSPQALISENFVPWALGQLQKVKIDFNTSIIFDINNSTNKRDIIKKTGDIFKIEGDFIIDQTIIEMKNVMDDPRKVYDTTYEGYLFRWPKENQKHLLAYKIINVLELNRGYHFLILIDITSLDLSVQEKEEIFKGFDTFLNKNRKLFGKGNEQKVHLKLIDRIQHPGIIKIETDLTKYILNNPEILQIADIYEDLLTKAKGLNPDPKNLKKTAEIFKDLQSKEQINFEEKLRATGILEYSTEEKILKKPLNFTEKISFQDRTRQNNFSEAKSSSLSSLFSQGDQLTKNQIIQAAETQKFTETRKQIKAHILSPEVLPSGEKIEAISTHLPVDNSKALVIYKPKPIEIIAPLVQTPVEKPQTKPWGTQEKRFTTDAQSILEKSGYSEIKIPTKKK